MFGLFGLALGLMLLHLWADHQNIHAVTGWVIQEQTKRNAAQ